MEIDPELIKDLLFESISEPYSRESIDEIRNSIESHGLINPIRVTKNGFDSGYTLVSGGKRLQAWKELCESKPIPVTIEERILSVNERKEASLTENLVRDNLTWYEQAALQVELHTLRIDQHGLKKRGNPGREERSGWSGVDTARELGIAIGTFNESLTVVNAINQNPNLKKVKDKKTALRLIRGVISRNLAADEAQLPASFEMNQVFLGDSLDILKSIPDNSFDVCLTDPPWIEYKDDSLIRDESTIDVFREVYRVLKNDSFCYVVISSTDIPDYERRLVQFGFQMQKYPIIWAKSGTISHGRRTWEYARDFEPILLFVKGRPSLTSPTEMSSILSHPSMNYRQMIHPHEKPISLLVEILQQCSYPGSKVLDPFAGSGATLEAARSVGREYVGIERDRERYLKVVKRMDK